MFKRIGRLFIVLTFAGWVGAASAYPITDTVNVAGKEWAQVDLFAGLSWNAINNVCGGSGCVNGTLNGFDMSGWTWASAGDLNALFNDFLVADGFGGSNLLGPGPDRFYWGFNVPTANFGRNFLNMGFRPTFEDYRSHVLTGWTSSAVTTDPSLAYEGVVGTYDPDGELFGTDYTKPKNRGGLLSSGAWFFRSDEVSVPVPATIPLLGSGLVALGYCRRKRNLFSRGKASTLGPPRSLFLFNGSMVTGDNLAEVKIF